MSIWVSQSVDLAIPCQEGTVAITVGDHPAPANALRLGSGQAQWQHDLDTVRRAVENLGGERKGRP